MWLQWGGGKRFQVEQVRGWGKMHLARLAASVGEAGFDLTRTPPGECHNKLSAFHDKFQLTLEHKFVFPEFGNGKNLSGRIFTGRETSPLCH